MIEDKTCSTTPDRAFILFKNNMLVEEKYQHIFKEEETREN